MLKIDMSCDKRVKRLRGKRIRVKLPEYNGYGVVDSIQCGIATIILEEEAEHATYAV